MSRLAACFEYLDRDISDDLEVTLQVSLQQIPLVSAFDCVETGDNIGNLLNYFARLSENKNQHVCHRVQRLSSKFQGFECDQHLDFKFLVMHIQRVKVLRRTPALGSTHSGQYRFDHLLAKDQQRRERADAWSA